MCAQRYTHRPLVHSDAFALLSLGFQLTFVLGLSTYRLHERGWPGWIRLFVPDWFPGPVDILYLLPLVSFIGICVLLLLRRWELANEHHKASAKIVWTAFAGTGVVLLIASPAYYRWIYRILSFGLS